MAHHLIAGWAGTGKSTITSALQARGLPAIDSDEILGLSAWRDRKTNQVVIVDYSQPIDFDRLGWFWDESVLSSLVHKYSDLFFCGNAANLWDLLPLFDHLFALDINETTQSDRLATRTNSMYGKQPDVLAYTLEAQKRFLSTATKHGATILNADQPVENIINQILAFTMSDQS